MSPTSRVQQPAIGIRVCSWLWAASAVAGTGAGMLGVVRQRAVIEDLIASAPA